VVGEAKREGTGEQDDVTVGAAAGLAGAVGEEHV